jgi:Flp pilus assembly protein TadG
VRRGPEEGAVAGLEALAFGVLVFVVGTLVIVNAWAVIDARFATSAAAREAVRSVVQAPDVGLTSAQLEERAQTAASQALAAHGYTGEPMLTGPPLTQSRCATVEITAELEVVPTVLPWVTQPLSYRVASTHAEVLDPFRAGLDGDGVTSCGF